MRLEWTLTKKRGNLRPRLTYTAALDEFEKGLCLPMVRMESPIPKPPDAYEPHCWPGVNERAGAAGEFHALQTPSHKTGTLTETLVLPWREDNRYPEVEEAFAALRRAFEAMLESAGASGPMDERGGLETTAAARRGMARAFLAERFLASAKP
jgi:hypothetical protein